MLIHTQVRASDKNKFYSLNEFLQIQSSTLYYIYKLLKNLFKIFFQRELNELFKAVHCIAIINLMNLANVFFGIINSLNSSSDLHTLFLLLLCTQSSRKASLYTPLSTSSFRK